MIRAVFTPEGFRAHGHAGYAPAGRDIVCAAVSAVLLTACEALDTVAHAAPIVRQRDEIGLLAARLPRNLSESTRRDARLILAAAEAGIRAIQRQYPDHVRLISRKWRRPS